MRGGCSVSNGTDCPVELPDAMAGIQCAVTRTTLRDRIGPYLPEEAFTVQEALDSYTIRSSRTGELGYRRTGGALPLSDKSGGAIVS